MDLISGGPYGQIFYYRNIGSAANPVLTFDSNLQVGGEMLSVGGWSHPWVNDWDEDGLKDLLVGANDGYVYLYINEGTNEDPLFNSTQQVTLASGSQVNFGARSGPVVVDLNGDGLKDLISGERDGYVHYCQNNGTNADPLLADPELLYTGWILMQPGAWARAAATDWDEDGDMDLLAGSSDGRLRLYFQAPTTEQGPLVELQNLGGSTIPPSGGTLTYAFSAYNPSISNITFDVWTEVKQSFGSFYGPLLVRQDLTLGPYDTISRTLTQAVPPGAPPGYYTYFGYAGNSEALQVYHSNSFNFTKSSGGDGGTGKWEISGWVVGDLNPDPSALPDRLSLNASPNPFNPVTTIQFDLPEADFVRLNVFNQSGRRVDGLMDGHRAAGNHQVTWDASALPSGIYIVALNVKENTETRKLTLIK